MKGRVKERVLSLHVNRKRWPLCVGVYLRSWKGKYPQGAESQMGRKEGGSYKEQGGLWLSAGDQKPGTPLGSPVWVTGAAILGPSSPSEIQAGLEPKHEAHGHGCPKWLPHGYHLFPKFIYF